MNILEKIINKEDFKIDKSWQEKSAFKYRIVEEAILECRPLTKNDQQKDIILSCAIHGNETAPIEILNEIIQEIFSGQLTLNHNVLFIFGNPQAMLSKKRFDDENLNRLFMGEWKNKEANQETKRAEKIESCVEKFYGSSTQTRLHYDLHTAIKPSEHEKFAIYPYLGNREHDYEQIAFLGACGVTNILLSNSPTKTFSYFSSKKFNAHSFTVELGKVKDFGKNDPSDFAAVSKTLRNLLSQLELELEKYEPSKFNIYKVVSSIIKKEDDFEFLVDDTKNFKSFSKGTIISKETGNEYVCEHENECIVFPNKNVVKNQRAALMVVKQN